MILLGAVVIRIGFFIRGVFFKKSTSQFRTLLMFWKRLATALDLLITLAIVYFIKQWFDERIHIEVVCLLVVAVGIRIALYFAIRAEEKKAIK
ncbi:MAG: hypothetical protein LBD11_08660 [Candidatus Peribacteria bacterium]|nr:hypothetical protein [Candidatus Peribacteria bacterium]